MSTTTQRTLGLYLVIVMAAIVLVAASFAVTRNDDTLPKRVNVQYTLPAVR